MFLDPPFVLKIKTVMAHILFKGIAAKRGKCLAAIAHCPRAGLSWICLVCFSLSSAFSVELSHFQLFFLQKLELGLVQDKVSKKKKGKKR